MNSEVLENPDGSTLREKSVIWKLRISFETKITLKILTYRCQDTPTGVPSVKFEYAEIRL